MLGEELQLRTNVCFPCAATSQGKGLCFPAVGGAAQRRGCPCCLPLPFSMCLHSCQSWLQSGRKERGEHRLLWGCDSQDTGQSGERKVSEGAKKYIQRSPCYASVRLQIALCTERVTEDVEGRQGKFGVR